VAGTFFPHTVDPSPLFKGDDEAKMVSATNWIGAIVGFVIGILFTKLLQRWCRSGP